MATAIGILFATASLMGFMRGRVQRLFKNLFVGLFTAATVLILLRVLIAYAGNSDFAVYFFSGSVILVGCITLRFINNDTKTRCHPKPFVQDVTGFPTE